MQNMNKLEMSRALEIVARSSDIRAGRLKVEKG